MESLYIDGTKIEANANRYSFVWRGSINYHLSGLLQTVDGLYERYNRLLSENGYDQKYQLEHIQMFIIQGIDRVREVIEKNRKRTTSEEFIIVIQRRSTRNSYCM